MRQTYSLLLLGVLLSSLAWAQTDEMVRVKSGEQLTTAQKYLFPQFAVGTVYLRNGQTPTARLNYQLQLREIQFIDPKGDTLTLANVHTVQRIGLNKEVFVFDQNGMALQLLGEYGSVKLTQNHSLQIVNVDKEVGFGQSSSLSSVNTYSSHPTAAGSPAKLEVKGDMMFSHKKFLYLINQNGLSVVPTRKTVLKLFPKHKSAVEQYLDDQPVQFHATEDLQRLLAYCAGLN